MKRNGGRPQSLWVTSKRHNLCIIGVPEREDREKGAESLFKEILAESFLNPERDLESKFMKITPKFLSRKIFSKTHYSKPSKVKDKEILSNAAREKISLLPETPHPIKLSVDFSADTLLARKDGEDIFKVLKKKKRKTINKEYFILPSCPSEMKT